MGGPLGRAVAFHSGGMLSEAETAYRNILKNEPAHFEALHLLGVLLAQRGQMDEALRLLAEAVAVNPAAPAAWNNYGNTLQKLNRVDDALAAYDHAIAVRPDYVEAHNNRGIALYDNGRFEDALADFDRALALKGDHASAHYNRANVLHRLGRLEDALAAFDAAIAANPNYAEAYNNRGTLLHTLGRTDDSLASYQQAASLKPQDPTLLYNLGTGLHSVGRIEDALASYDGSLARNGANPDVWRARGNALHDLRRFAEALASYDTAISIDPAAAENFNTRGNTLKSINRFEDALGSYDRAIALAPDHAKAQYNRGIVLENLGRFEDALNACDAATQAAPEGNAEAEAMAFLLAGGLCDWHGLSSRRERLIAATKAGQTIPPYAMLTVVDSPELQAKAAVNFTNAYHPPRGRAGARPKPPARTKRRIAYVSADFYTHATTHLAAGLFERHNRESFEVYGVSVGPNDNSPMRARLEAGFDRFIDAFAKSDFEVARLLTGLNVDIAIDLKGHTRDSRPGIFAFRPCPIAVSYLGYAGTMGANYIDYLLADATVIPEGTDHFYTEQVVRLPFSYQINDSRRVLPDAAMTRSDAGLPEQGFVYCSFNNPHKIMPEIFDVWMRLLESVPDSVLWLNVTHDRAKKNLTQEALARGIDAARLVFAGFEPDLGHHLSRLALADLVLDTLPYNAHTTASDALWAAVPVVTCLGESFPARVAASLLQAAGLPELVTSTLADYETLAKKLALDPALLRGFKERLKTGRESCALFDTGATTRHIEAAYETMWDRQVRGLPVQGFAVPAAHG